MTRYVYGHGKQKPEHVFGVEVGQNCAQTHCTASVGQLVQNGPEFRALIEISAIKYSSISSTTAPRIIQPGCMTIKGIQER